MRFLEEKIRERLSQKNAEDIIKRLHMLRRWSWEVELVPRHRRPYYDRLTFAALFSFIVTFTIARTFSTLVTFGKIPDIFLNVRGIHVHHFVYGFVVLAISGFLALISFSPKNKIWIALLYGCGLGLAVDEAGQWLLLEDQYWARQSFDAVVIVSFILLFIIYLPRYLQIFYRRFKARPVMGQEELRFNDNGIFPGSDNAKKDPVDEVKTEAKR